MKIIRATTVPTSLNSFCKGLLTELREMGYETIGLSSPGEALEEVEEREQIRTIAVQMQRRISPIKDLISLFKLVKTFRKEKPDIVHSMTPKAGLLCMLASWICRVPLRIHTFTGLVFPTAKGLTQKILILTDQITCACATNVIPEGEGVKNDLINYHITKKSLNVLGYGNVRGIDLDYFNPSNTDVQKEAAKIRKEGIFTFVFIGRLVRDKGINELISAFSKLNKEYKNTRLILVGPYEQKIDPINAETSKEIEENPAIDAVGRQNDVRPWLLASDALAFPSYREGFPNVVIEAGAMELPSIVTDINGSREIIINGKNGIIIPSKDSDALYRAMKSLIDNPNKRLEMAKNSRPLIESRFEQSFVHKCLKDYYKEISGSL